MSLHPLAVLVIAMVAVLGGVLLLRLHAFLALVLGALLVACLTPRQALFDQALRDAGSTFDSITADGVAVRQDRERRVLDPGNYSLFRYRPDRRTLEQLGSIRVQDMGGDAGRVVRLTGPDADFRPVAGDIVVSVGQLAAARAVAEKSVGRRLAEGFGGTCAEIGLLIAMASIIGKCLLESGAAERIVATIRKFMGERAAPLALAVSSYIVAIPVFFDTVFYLMIPLARAMARKTGRNYLLYVLSIVAGGTISHSLVPPTPGPLFVASAFDVSVGLMMLGGGVVAAIGVVCVFPYILWANRRWPIPLRQTGGGTADSARTDQAERALAPPPFWLAILPIVLPVVLIGGEAIVDSIPVSPTTVGPAKWLEWGVPVLRFVGDKNVALMLAAAIALATLWKYAAKERAAVRSAVQDALAGAGVIILITAAGGAFGSVLRSTGIATAIEQMMPPSESGISLLVLAFLLTSLVRAAQGSATVSMIAAAGIVAPLAATIQLPYHPLYLALAVGSGSKPFSWMNDSGFWIVGRMSGFTEAETLKTFSAVLTIMGIACLGATIAGALVFPMV